MLGCLVPDALSWPSKEGEHVDSLIQLPLAEKQIEKDWSGNEKAAALVACAWQVQDAQRLSQVAPELLFLQASPTGLV